VSLSPSYSGKRSAEKKKRSKEEIAEKEKQAQLNPLPPTKF
jgi:hypothetical protein